MRRYNVWMALAAASVIAGCGGAGAYVWVNDMPPEPPTAHDYRIHAGDTISVHVFGQETMTTKARVRTDGRIAFPILGEIEVRDKRPADLARELEARLTEYVVTPHVTVAVEDVQPLLVSVMGEVGKQGIYTLDPNAGVVQAIASAGGITDFADHDGIFVVRAGHRIRFSLASLTRGEGKAAAFRLEAGDLVVVE